MRYIDADKFIAELEQEKTVALEFEDGVAVYEIEHMMNLIGMQPTADVVPKSEVEGLQTEIEELQARVAKLRKENIELLVSKETDIYISMEKLVKVRTEHPIFKAIEEKVAREIFEEIEEMLKNQEAVTKNQRCKEVADWIFHSYIPRKIAELKKKYTEDRT